MKIQAAIVRGPGHDRPCCGVRPSVPAAGTKRHWTHKNDAAVLLLKAKFPFTGPCNPNGAMGLLTELITVSATERGGDDLTTLSLVRDMAMMASQLGVLNFALSMFEKVLPNMPRLLEPTSKLLFTTRSEHSPVETRALGREEDSTRDPGAATCEQPWCCSSIDPTDEAAVCPRA